MPRQNLTVLVAAAVISLLCYQRAARNRYAATVANAMGQVAERFVRPVERRDLFEGAMKGMLSNLDPYSSYISPDDYLRLRETLDQEFGGVGMIVDVDVESTRPVVTWPRPDAPAYAAGIRAGDLILEIDGRDTMGMPPDETIKLIRGQSGTLVKLRIQPASGDAATEVSVRRADIPVESVMGYQRRPDGKWAYRLPGHPEIGYIWIESFGDLTAEELERALRQALPNVRGLIFDVRENAGGLLDAAVAVCDMFLDQGQIVSVRGRDPRDTRMFSARATKTIVPVEIPIVVLADKFSASAAEIFAACLQDSQRAVVIGERTWGKGTVQNLIELEAGRSALRLTTATYWRPSGHNIHRLPDNTDKDEWGVQPNDGFEVKLSEDEFKAMVKSRRDRFAAASDINGAEDATENPPEEDPQLLRAIEYIDSMLTHQRKAA